MAKVILFILVLAVAGGIGYLAVSDVQAPTQAVEKPIATETFFQK